MKCMPMTFSGRVVTDPILVIEILDVLLAKTQCAGAKASNCLKIFNLISMFSVAASTTKSALLTPSAN